MEKKIQRIFSEKSNRMFRSTCELRQCQTFGNTNGEKKQQWDWEAGGMKLKILCNDDVGFFYVFVRGTKGLRGGHLQGVLRKMGNI
jgi:hypothetical protein